MKKNYDCRVVLDPPGIIVYPISDLAKSVMSRFAPYDDMGYGFYNNADEEFAPYTVLGAAGLTYFIESNPIQI